MKRHSNENPNQQSLFGSDLLPPTAIETARAQDDDPTPVATTVAETAAQPASKNAAPHRARGRPKGSARSQIPAAVPGSEGQINKTEEPNALSGDPEAERALVDDPAPAAATVPEPATQPASQTAAPHRARGRPKESKRDQMPQSRLIKVRIDEIDETSAPAGELKKQRAEMPYLARCVQAIAPDYLRMYLPLIAPIGVTRQGSRLLIVSGVRTHTILRSALEPATPIPVLEWLDVTPDDLGRIAVFDFYLMPLYYKLSQSGIKTLLKFFSNNSAQIAGWAREILPKVRSNRDFEALTGIREATIYRKPKNDPNHER